MPAPPARKTTKRKLTPRKKGPVVPFLIIYAVPGFGKTTIGAYAPDPVILMSRGEFGYLSLLSAGRVPAVPAVEVETWTDTLEWLDDFIKDPQGRKTLVLDALGGFARLNQEHICHTKFKDDWGEDGYLSWGKGDKIATIEWLKLIQRLEQVQLRCGIAVILLGHCKVKTHKNPMGTDYDRWVCDVEDGVWGETKKPATCVLFGSFFTTVTKDRPKDKKGKGIGLADRVFYATHRAAFDAKNHYGMDEEFDAGDDPAEVWNIIWAQITGAKE